VKQRHYISDIVAAATLDKQKHKTAAISRVWRDNIYPLNPLTPTVATWVQL